MSDRDCYWFDLRRQVEYMDWLAEQVGEPRLEARRREMYERALECIWSLDGGYRDQGDADIAL